MKNEQNMRLLNVVLYGLAAVIWIANAVVHIALAISPLPNILLAVFCALLWSFSFVVHLLRYLDIRKQP